jgi:hypothetical protein
MYIEGEKDFPELRNQFTIWRRRFPMFTHDVRKLQDTIENEIKEHSIALMHHRQSHKRFYIEKAQSHIDNINNLILTIEKIELMALLSRR